MKPWLLFALFLSPSASIGAFALYMILHDRRRDRQACRRIVTLIERDRFQSGAVFGPTLKLTEAQLDRLRSGAAFAEAMALQLEEIRALPERQR